MKDHTDAIDLYHEIAETSSPLSGQIYNNLGMTYNYASLFEGVNLIDANTRK